MTRAHPRIGSGPPRPLHRSGKAGYPVAKMATAVAFALPANQNKAPLRLRRLSIHAAILVAIAALIGWVFR